METAAPWSRWLHTMAAVSRERAWRWCEGRRPRSSWQPCHACSVLPRLAANVTGGAAAVHDCFGSSEWALRMFDCHANAKVIELVSILHYEGKIIQWGQPPTPCSSKGI
ncbi:uncharacterized protein [Triticum aestivum]|uniref:uncharacterized protein isoform X3 n=1 Tax=Triticum aestivum TaxID=4565 RepID=UPI001D0204D6|nr:uncharacterized protein LOC123077945 isoform X3 [Triticum aestivum]XP_044356266.1 uncharacterized protein LOC123077945 isoform X3 [Triticum aestivum]XP_044356267.1 uncharacterized protein LOC123077945 isoform X3 [Triticum aestivum]XP_044356268.1 uncharacterized protein LOC123077945 isoform X3 [Triticum aestivum]